MAVYSISYDLVTPGQKHEAVRKEIKTFLIGVM